MVNNFSYLHCWFKIKNELIMFPHPCTFNLQEHIFLRRINHRLLVLLSPMLYFGGDISVNFLKKKKKEVL